MQRQKKFGTFGGVFTPAFLTIISVILYLRLGWIVGQAGLLYTVGIILLANIISITTGLSLSSIATDKKVKAGGVYYMLSRSLGLSIGGAIGATMYMAFGLSIALNIVGFTESFLAVELVRDFLGLDPGIQSLRIVGSAILLLLVIIAFISTSFAIKIQYLVLTGIILSWISIIAGLLINNQFHPVQPILLPYEGHLSLTVLFAIYFPAATGFMMGAAMSGDLKDPRNSIPRGTMLAIIGGLFINLALAVSFAFFVNRELLLTDPAFLQKVAFIPLLVIIGIWGATLSTALGAILGGPRVLQAMANDRLAPSFLGKGHGVNNEPHRAILLTFVIALTAILIGDLNAIARIATMFFITAYAFINFSFALESWANSDFRPSFKVPRWVGLVGFIACVFVMMQIDLLAMIIAFSLLWVTWLIMKRRENKLTHISIWQSVWTSVIRHALYRLNRKKIDEPNWKPNIILFSTSPKTRPYFLEMGEYLIANHGLLTIVDLKLNTNGPEPATSFRDKLGEQSNTNNKGIFFREYYCNNIFDAIENISETYGFPGMEPNSVLLGWAMKSSDKERFARLIKKLSILDYNILLMDYDMPRGFGGRKTIDIWWHGPGNNGNLAINLVKFLSLSNTWKGCKIRLMIENPINDEYEAVYNFAGEVLDNHRIKAQIAVINNEDGEKHFYEIIRNESRDTDIVFIGLPEFGIDDETNFIDKTHSLCLDLGSVVFIKASTQFKRLAIGPKSHIYNNLTIHRLPKSTSHTESETFNWPEGDEAASTIQKFYSDTLNPIRNLQTKSFLRILNLYNEIINEAQNRVNATFNIIDRKIGNENNNDTTRQNTIVLFKLTGQTFIRYERILTLLQNNLEEQQHNLNQFFNEFFTKTRTFYEHAPRVISIPVKKDLTNPRKFNLHSVRSYMSKLVGSNKNNGKQNIKFRKLVKQLYPQTYYTIIDKTWFRFSEISLQYLDFQQHTFRMFCDSLHLIESAVNNGTYSTDILKDEMEKMESRFSVLKEFLANSEVTLVQIANQENQDSIRKIWETIKQINTDGARNKYIRIHPIKKIQAKKIEEYPMIWKRNLFLRINYNILEMNLKIAGYKLGFYTKQATGEFKAITELPGHIISSDMLSQLIDFCNICQKHADYHDNLPASCLSAETKSHIQFRIKETEDFILSKMVAIVNNIPVKIELLKNNTNPVTDDLLTNSSPETSEIEVSRLVNFFVQNDLITLLQQDIQGYARELAAIEKELTETYLLLRIASTGDKEDNVPTPNPGFFKEQKKRVVDVALRLEMIKSSLEVKFDNISNNISRQFRLPAFLKTVEASKLYTRKKVIHKYFEPWIAHTLQRVKKYSGNQLIKLLFAQSKRTVEQQKTISMSNDGIYLTRNLLHLSDAVTVKDSILALIPSHYQHLFLRKNNHFIEFWYGRQKQLEEAAQMITRHDNGSNGALLIRGEQNSGKSFLANYICHKYLSNRSIYFMQPPFHGSASENDFISSLCKATERDGDSEGGIINSLPDKSVIVIEDLELWWEKRPGGSKVLELIGRLIENYSTKILFLITVNSNALSSINRIKPISHFMLDTIDCQPFDAEEIKTIIMIRHKSGNIHLRLGNKNEEELLGWNLAQLFNSYFKFSRGNIGICLQTWIACITRYEDETLFIRTPVRPDTSVLDKLDGETLLFLAQFILHKRITTEKAARIFMIPELEANNRLRSLTRASLLIEPNPGIYTLNPNIQQFIKEKLQDFGLV